MGKAVKVGWLGSLVLWILLGPLPVHSQTSSQGSTPHTVAWGDTLFSIAQQYGTTVDTISRANGLADPARIHAGQRLIIPTAYVPTVPSVSGASHTVQVGENLYRIALQYGVTVKSLVELNGIYNPDQLFAGQTLTIPGSPAASSVAYQPQHASTTHTVQHGETLTSIANQHGIALWTLIQVNSIANSALILPGQTLVIPNPTSLASPSPSAGPTGSKRIVVDLSEQHLYAFQGSALVHSFVVSTGMAGANTRPGTYQVLDKYTNAYASTWNLQMPFWLGIYWSGSLENGIHALPILSNGQRLWEGYLGTPVSYGCIVLGTQQAQTLFYWAEVGTPVVIQQ